LTKSTQLKNTNLDKKILGIVGGIGPETTSKFYLELIEKSRMVCDSYPSIIIDSISFPFSLEEEIIQESKNENKIFPILKESIARFNKIGVNLIVIPCNTVHVFIDGLRKESNVPIISIIDETIKRIKDGNYRNVGLLASKKTIDSKLYEIPMKKNGTNIILPTDKEQKEISKIIIETIRNKITEKRKNVIKEVIKNLIKRGSDVVVLGCTDLQIILNNYEFDVELLDSFEILLESTFQRIMKKGELK
jgi:aspartate racemase